MNYNYFVSVFVAGKNVSSYWSDNLDDLVTIKAMYKGCDICIFDFHNFAQLSVEDVQREIGLASSRWRKSLEKPAPIVVLEELPSEEVAAKPKKSKPRKYWERPVMCVETGQVFASIRECSDKLGIPYMTIANCIRRGNTTRGVHFSNAPKMEPIENFIDSKYSK